MFPIVTFGFWHFCHSNVTFSSSITPISCSYFCVFDMFISPKDSLQKTRFIFVFRTVNLSTISPFYFCIPLDKFVFSSIILFDNEIVPLFNYAYIVYSFRCSQGNG